jgi:hypothetical protein
LSSFDSSGMKMPARLPDASCAGASWRSISVTRHPRAHKRSQAAAPARPAPMTMARFDGVGGTDGCGRWLV